MSGLDELIAALHAQTEAIDRLVSATAALMEALADAEDTEPEPARYMDGTPVA